MQKLQCHWTKIKQTTRNRTVTSPSMRLTSIGQLVNGPWTRLESWFLKSLFQGFVYAQSKAFRRQRWYYSSRERWKWKLYLFCMAKSKAWVLSHIGMYRKINKFWTWKLARQRCCINKTSVPTHAYMCMAKVDKVIQLM